MLRKSHLASVAVAGIASLTLISGAHADGYEPAGKAMAAPVADYAWGGFYVGVGVGGASFDNSVGVDASKDKKFEKKACIYYIFCTPWYEPRYSRYRKPDSTSARFSDDEWNVFGTLQVGYDHMLGKRFFAGVFGDYDFYQDSDHSFSKPWIKNSKYGDYEVGSIDGNIELENMWSVGGKLGFLVSPRWAIYGVGGYSEAELDGSVDVTFKNHYGYDTVLSLAAPDDLKGYFVGGGTEVKLHRNVSLKFEYRYTDLDSDSASDSLTKTKKWKDCYYYGYYGCKVSKKYKKTKEFDARADFDAEIHSVRAVLVISLTPEERVVAPLK